MIKRLFLSRSTVTTLILVALAMVTVGGFVPQTFITSPDELERWRQAHQLAARTADVIGLHHIYTTPGFALVLALVFVSLSMSSLEQFRSVWRLMKQNSLSDEGAEIIESPLTPEVAIIRLRDKGFRPMGTEGETVRLVRHPWGYWGKFLLHLGMVITIIASILIAVTQQRAMLKLTVGESFVPGQPWSLDEKGVFASEFRLEDSVRLDGVDYEYWPNAGLRRLSSTLLLTSGSGEQLTHTISINSILLHRGVRIYQDSRFGHSFRLAVTMPDGRIEQRLVELPHPLSPDQAGYGDYPDVLAPGTVLRLKYLVNDGQKSFTPVDPTLFIRIEGGASMQNTISLKQGQDANIGSYSFRLIGYTNWSQLIFVRLLGIEAVFLGFIIICIGGLLHYFTPPREVTVRPADGRGSRIEWQATRFGSFYGDEPGLLRRELSDEDNHG